MERRHNYHTAKSLTESLHQTWPYHFQDSSVFNLSNFDKIRITKQFACHAMEYSRSLVEFIRHLNNGTKIYLASFPMKTEEEAEKFVKNFIPEFKKNN